MEVVIELLIAPKKKIHYLNGNNNSYVPKLKNISAYEISFDHLKLNHSKYYSFDSHICALKIVCQFDVFDVECDSRYEWFEKNIRPKLFNNDPNRYADFVVYCILGIGGEFTVHIVNDDEQTIENDLYVIDYDDSIKDNFVFCNLPICEKIYRRMKRNMFELNNSISVDPKYGGYFVIDLIERTKHGKMNNPIEDTEKKSDVPFVANNNRHNEPKKMFLL